MKWSGALVARPFFPSLWVRLTFCNKNIPSILKARCSASSFVRSRVTISARLHKRHQIMGVCVLGFFCQIFLNVFFFLLSIFPYNRAICHMWDREKEIVPVDDIYKQKPTSLLLMLEYLSAFFVKQCQNVSQHHHYIIEKECRKYGPAHFK